MTREEIIRMAVDSGLYSGNPRTPGTENMIVRRLEKFAAMVEAVEREACAKLADKQRPVSRDEAPAHWVAYEKSWGLRDMVASDIATAIRARGCQ